MAESTLVERIRMHPRPGDRLVSARGTMLRVLDVRDAVFDMLVVFLVVPEVEGEPPREKELLLRRWREAPDWDQVVYAYGGSFNGTLHAR